MAAPHLPTYAEMTATPGEASPSCLEGTPDQTLAVTIDTHRGNVIEQNIEHTAEKRDSSLISVIGLAFGGCMYFVGSLTNDRQLRALAIVPVVLAFLKWAGVLRVALAFADGIKQKSSVGVCLMMGVVIYFVGTVSDSPTLMATALVPVVMPFAFDMMSRRRRAVTNTTDRSAAPPQVTTNASDDGVLIQYKQILCSVLPLEFLSAEGLLRTAACASQIKEGSQKMLAGGSEEIRILSPRKQSLWSLLTGRSSQQEFPPASYEGALAYKILRYYLEKHRAEVDPKEYEPLSKYVDSTLLWHGGRDVIDIRSATHKGVLAHEAFHDIQGFLYDNHSDIVDNLFAAMDKRRPQIEDWYNNIADSSYRGPLQYTLSHFFPNRDSPVVNPSFGYEAFLVLARATKPEIPSRVGSETIYRALSDLGRNELLPVMICAASEGDDRAAGILSEIFGEAGLNKDFYATLPRV